MVGRSTCRGRFGALKAQVLQLEFFYKRIDDTVGVARADVVGKALGKPRDLATVVAFDESLH